MNKVPSRLTILAVISMLALASMKLQAATGPSWWVTRGVVNTNSQPNDFAAVNQGQLKWMAVNAAVELESQLPGGAGNNVGRSSSPSAIRTTFILSISVNSSLWPDRSMTV